MCVYTHGERKKYKMYLYHRPIQKSLKPTPLKDNEKCDINFHQQIKTVKPTGIRIYDGSTMLG